MVRKYKKKSDKNAWTDQQMQLAINSVLGGKSTKSTALEFGIPRATLQRKLQLHHSKNTSNDPSQNGFKRVFTPEQEQALCKYIIDMQNRLMGLTSMDIRRLAFQYAEKLKISHKFNKSKELAGKDWLNNFMSRHELSHRKAEHTSTARANGFNKVAVQEFFDLLEKCISEYNIKSEDIYNVDESGVSVNPKSTSKIVAKKGVKQVGGLTAAERGETVTAELCMSATGKFMPPMLIFPRVNRNDEFLAEAPAGAWGEFHKSGWIQNELFTKWFKEFIKFSQASEEKKVLLLLDGHSSHIKDIDVIDLARDNGVIIVCFPPHCTHRLQPLDVAFMKPLSHFYTEAVMEWQRLGHKTTLKDIFKLFGKAWQRASKIETAVNGFKKTGICPFNRNVFKDSDYAVLRRESSLIETVIDPQVQENVQIIEEIHQNHSNFTLNNGTESSPQSFSKPSNAEHVMVSVESIKEAQSLIKSLNSILTNMIPSSSLQYTKQFTLPDPFDASNTSTEQFTEPVVSSDTVKNLLTMNNSQDFVGKEGIKSVAKIVEKKAKGQAAIITDEAYKENLIAQKLKTIKKEPKETKKKKSATKPKILSNIEIKEPIKMPMKRKAACKLPQVRSKKVLKESQNFQEKQQLLFNSHTTQQVNTVQAFDSNGYPILYQLDLTANNDGNICFENVPGSVVNHPILIQVDENFQMCSEAPDSLQFPQYVELARVSQV